MNCYLPRPKQAQNTISIPPSVFSGMMDGKMRQEKSWRQDWADNVADLSKIVLIKLQEKVALCVIPLVLLSYCKHRAWEILSDISVWKL